MKYLSVCSGIEAATVAWHPLGWQAVAFSEVDAFPSAVLAHHYPNVPNLGDMTKFEAWPDAAPDVLVGGTPCQSFSVAGLRAGLRDPRGNLMLTFGAIAARYRPRWLVWENVPGVLSSNRGRDFGTFLGMLGELGYGFAYRVLDAQYFGVAQRRRRVFVVGCLGDWRRAAAVLFERASLRGDPAPRRETGEGAARPIAAGSARGSGYRNDADTAENLIPSTGDISHCLNAGGMGRQDFETETLIAHALRGEGFDARQSDVIQYGDKTGPLDTGGHTIAVQTVAQVRRLTPRECERLQGFPDDYTLIPLGKRGTPAKDGPRYKALGNSMAVPVMRWIGERIDLVESIGREVRATA